MIDPNLQQQIFDAVSKANRVLIPLSESPTGDSLAAALALGQFLKKLNKEPHIVCRGQLPERYRFFPGADGVRTTLEESRGFVISVRTNNAPLDELSYHLDEPAQTVNIYLKPKAGRYEPGDVAFRSDRFPYDLIFSLGVPSLDLFGELYDSNTDLFFETPIVNVDHHPNNEHFGEINLIEITASSTAEILMELLEGFEGGLFEPSTATNLLAGILIETNSFQNRRTTPKAFLKASTLISMGADQQQIIKHLYKTKSVAHLKLWGRALARLKETPELGLHYSVLRKEDVERAGSADSAAVMEELASSLTEAKIILLLTERDPELTEGLLAIHPSLASLDIPAQFGAVQYAPQLYRFTLAGQPITESEKDALARLERFRSKLAII